MPELLNDGPESHYGQFLLRLHRPALVVSVKQFPSVFLVGQSHALGASKADAMRINK